VLGGQRQGWEEAGRGGGRGGDEKLAVRMGEGWEDECGRGRRQKGGVGGGIRGEGGRKRSGWGSRSETQT